MSHSGDAPQLAAPKPVLMSADLSGLLTHKQPPPLPSPSLKPRKLSNPPAAAQVSPASRRRKMSKAQQRQELMEGTGSSTNNIGFDDDDDDDDFGEVSPRARIVSQRRDSDVVPSKSRSPSRQLDAARPRASPETRRAPATQPFDHAAPCADGATGPYEVPVTDEQVWREFVIEENYSVLATKGILQRIADFNHSHKAIQILKMQNAALAEVDRQNDEIHGMDLVEKEKEKERMNIKKKKSIRRVGSKKGSSGDTESTSNEADDEFSAVGADGSSSEPNSAVGSGGGGAGSGSGGRRKRNGKSGKAKDLFKSDFIIKMKLQMKKHLNELCKRDYPRVRFSGRCHVNFLHGELLQRKKEYVSEITLQNIGVRTARIKMQQFGTSPRDSVFDLVAEPNEFEIPKGKKQVVTFKLTVHSSKAIVSEVIGVEIGWRENSKEAKTKDKSNLRFPRRLCIYVSGLGEAAVFGVPLSQVEMVPWEAAGKSHRSGLVPKVLVDLRENLIRTGGLQQEGIFRKAPSDVETQQAKHALNVGTFDSSQFNNPQLYAHLIKLWFRDLPDSVLQHVHEEELILCKQLPACLKIVESIPPEFRTIFDWLLELMSEVVDCSDVNFMNPANLGIVMGPNLLPNVDAANPMQALMLNKACTTFLTVLIKGDREEQVFISPT